jgi:hypothetical protein
LRTERSIAVADLLFTVVAIISFIGLIAFVYACDRL